MNAPKVSVYRILVVLMTVVVWLQVYVSWRKDRYIGLLEYCIEEQIEENTKTKNELHEMTVRAAKLAEDLEKVGRLSKEKK